ncbi:MAG: helix-turn-helix domain-containing protein [Nitriliruptoraceae bacterium]
MEPIAVREISDDDEVAVSTGPGSRSSPERRVLDLEQDPDARYQQELGQRLRAVRRAHDLRLQDVEEATDGRFKAVVVGSYERGDRAIAAHKLAALADFYAVPVAELLPERADTDAAAEPGVVVDVDQLRQRAFDPKLEPLVRLIQHVQQLRDDHHSRTLRLRSEDQRLVALALGVEADGFSAWLEARGLLAR